MMDRSSGINLGLIYKLTGEKDLNKIKRLDFYSKSNKIKRIDSLEGCVNLQELILSYNYISKIENLSHLFKLKTLDLSENSIKRLENLDSLSALESLNLAGNLIKEIDKDCVKGLISLRTLNISKNKIARISEFGNLEVLLEIENLFTVGNLVKQSDLKDYIPIKLKSLKFLDGESVIQIPSESVSSWMSKENLKELKLRLKEKCKEHSILSKEVLLIQDQIKNIEKSAPDKKYMKELLDKADTLHDTLVSIQQNMTHNRELQFQFNQRLENIKSNERDSGNFIVEEIKLVDDLKRITATIDDLEVQYSLILEELEKVAKEITSIDDLINNTPKFKTNETKALENKSQSIGYSIKSINKDIEEIKERIEECYKALGINQDLRELSKSLEKIWKKVTDEIWIEENEDNIIDHKRLSEKVCEIIEKERTEFLIIINRHTDEVNRLEARIKFLTNGLKAESDKRALECKEFNEERKILGKRISDIENKQEFPVFIESANKNNREIISKVDEQIVKRNKELSRIESLIQDNSMKLSEITEKLRDSEKYAIRAEGSTAKAPRDLEILNTVVYKLSETLKVPHDIQLISVEIEKFCKKFTEYKEKCSRFKAKKISLVEMYLKKNQEISEKIKQINTDRSEISKDKAELKLMSAEAIKLRQEIFDEENHLAKLKESSNSLDNEKIRLDYRIKNLKEECEAFQEKKNKLFNETQRVQTMHDSEAQKYEELQREIIEARDLLRNSQEALKEIEEKSKSTANIHSRQVSEIKSKENLLYYLEHQIEETQVKLRTELEAQIKVTKQRESEIKSLNSEIENKKKIMQELSSRISEKSEKILGIDQEAQVIHDKCEEYRIKAMSNEGKISEIDRRNRELKDEIKSKENKLLRLDCEIKEKLDQLEKIQMKYHKELQKEEQLSEKIKENEISLRNLVSRVNNKQEELSRLSDIQTKRSEIQTQRDERILSTFRSHEDLVRSSVDAVPSNEYKYIHESLASAKRKKAKLIKEISNITTIFSTKELEFNENILKLQQKIDTAESTLSRLRDAVQSATTDLLLQEKKSHELKNEIASLENIQSQLKSNNQDLNTLIRDKKAQLIRLKAQENESLVILALGGFEVDQGFRERISKFVSSLDLE